MKRMLNKTWRSLVALLLVFSMVLGASGNLCVAVVEASEQDDVINLVSFGDSMTNGYGLDGYNEGNRNVNGYLQNDTKAYPAQLAEYLRGTGAEVEHTQLAISCMRAEDLRFTLELDYEDEKVIEFINKIHNAGFDFETQLQEEWDTLIGVGDKFTYDEFVDSRFDDWDDAGYKDANGGAYTTLDYAEQFQKATAEADIITIGSGNANFGVFLLHRIVDAVGIFGQNPGSYSWIHVEDAMKDLDPESRAFAMELYAALKAKLPAGAPEMLNTLVDLITFTAVSYMINYKGALDRIAELNEGADIMIVGLMNTMEGMILEVYETDEDGEYVVDAEGNKIVTATFNLGDYMGTVMNTMNNYLAGLASVMQFTEEENYMDHRFLFAEAEGLTKADMIYSDLELASEAKWEGKGFDIVRDRIVTEVNDLVFEMLGNPNKVNVNEVYDYCAMSEMEKLAYAASNADKAASLVMYLGFEDATVKASTLNTLDSGAFIKLATGIDDVFDGVMDQYKSNIAAHIAASINEGTGYWNVVSAVVLSTIKNLLPAGMSLSIVFGEEEQYAYADIQELLKDYLVNGPDAVIKNVADTVAKNMSMSMSMIGTAMDYDTFLAVAQGTEDPELVAQVKSIMEIANQVPDIYDGYVTAYTLLDTPDALSSALTNDSTVYALLHLFARFLVGNGIGCHPSQNGHDKLSKEVIKTYVEGFTVQQETNENIIKVVKALADLVAEYYDDAYAYAYDYAVENGYIDILTEGLDAADKALADIDVDAIPLSEEFTAEFKEKLEESIADARATIAQAKKLILEADELDQASLDELLALLDTLLADVIDVAELLKIAAVDTYNDVMIIVIDTLIKLRDQAEKQLTIAIQKGTEWLMDKVQEAFDALVKAFMEALPVADQYLYDWFYNNPDKVIGFFYEYGDDMGTFMTEHYEAFLAVIGYIGYTFGDDVLAFVMENPETVLKAMVNWYETYGERTWVMIDRYAEYLGLYDYLEEVKGQLEDAYAKAEEEVKEEIAKAIAEIEAKLTEIKGLIEEAIKESAEEAEKVILEKLEELGAVIEELVAKIEAILEEAVSAEYIPTADSKYVSIGDSSVTGTGSKEAVVPYAKRLAEELKLTDDQFVNLGLNGATTADLFKVVEDNAAELKDADLITVGLSVNAMLVEALNAAKADELPEYDWNKYLPEEAVLYIQEKLAEVEAELAANEAMAKYAPMMASVVEGLGYNYVEFAFEYPELVNRIHELAAEDAQVIMVGMYNPMEGLEFADINLGEYVEYITRIANIHLTAYSLITPDTVYVSAPDVDTFAEHTEYKNDYLFLLNLVNGTHFKAQFATGEGHEYIKEQILDRMNIIRLWGDVNKDGKVNSKDAVAILRYLIRLVDASELDLTVGDLNADGKVSSKDAVLILQYCIKLITKFPVEA